MLVDVKLVLVPLVLLESLESEPPLLFLEASELTLISPGTDNEPRGNVGIVGILRNGELNGCWVSVVVLALVILMREGLINT